MNRYLSKSKSLVLLCCTNPKMMLQILRQRFHSRSRAFGLIRDLDTFFASPTASIPFTVRALRPDDAAELLNLKTPGIDSEGIHLRISRLKLLDANIPACYVAETTDGHPCYMQWLFGANQNRALQDYYKGYFPWLAGDEALLEGAFTPEKYRGYRIMPAAMAQIATEATKLGARKIITFVGEENIASLKGCKRAGFHIYLLREERWWFFRRKIQFTKLPDNTPFPFDEVVPMQPAQLHESLFNAQISKSGRRSS